MSEVKFLNKKQVLTLHKSLIEIYNSLTKEQISEFLENEIKTFFLMFAFKVKASSSLSYKTTNAEDKRS